MFVATSKDLTAAVGLLAVSVVPMVVGLPIPVLEVIETNPMVFRAAWVVALLALLYKKYTLTAIVLLAVGLLVRFEVFSSFMYSEQGILAQYAALNRADPRFSASSSVDLQIADGTLVRDPARWLDPGRKHGPLLLYPPSPEQLLLISSNGARVPEGSTA